MEDALTEIEHPKAETTPAPSTVETPSTARMFQAVEPSV